LDDRHGSFRPFLDIHNKCSRQTEQSCTAGRAAFITGQHPFRTGDWKVVFADQRAKKYDVWRDPFVDLRTPKLFHLRRDPFERADTDTNQYNHWWAKRAPFIALPLQKTVADVVELKPPLNHSLALRDSILRVKRLFLGVKRNNNILSP